LIQKVKAENKFTEYPEVFAALASSLDTNYTAGKFQKSMLPEFAKKTKPSKPVRGNVFLAPDLSTTPLLSLSLCQLGDEQFTVGEFANYLEKNTRPYYGKLEEGLKQQYDNWVSENCVGFQDRHLEEKSVEFRNIYQEYAEGILMFYRKKDKVWDKAGADSAGLANFFSKNRETYVWKDRIFCQVVFSEDEATMKMVAKQLKKNISLDSIKRFHNLKKPLSVDYKTGKYEITDNYLFADKNMLPALFENKKSKKKNAIIQLGKFGEDWVTVKIIEFKPAGLKELNETRGPVTAQYEEFLEAEWVKELQARYTVEINKAVVEEFKKKLMAK
jgi:peptidyl-prolyl cis-trans isomerase SurA